MIPPLLSRSTHGLQNSLCHEGNIRLRVCECAPHRRALLPVLSKRWAGLLQGPGPAWEEAEIETSAEFPDATEADAAAMVAWFSRRSGSVRELCVDGSLPKLPVSLMAAVLMSQASSLRVLSLDAAAVAWVSSRDVAVLAALTGLGQLTIQLPEDPAAACWDDQAAVVAANLDMSQVGGV